jgi:hypothetical protein
MITGCATNSAVQQDAESQIIGVWKSVPLQTEIGHGHIQYKFTDDGRYTMHFETDLIQLLPREGEYRVVGNRLITIGQQQRDSSPFWFEDDVLVIPDGSNIVRLNRM